eukprot:7384053-Prymnesium_polylepis.6
MVACKRRGLRLHLNKAVGGSLAHVCRVHLGEQPVGGGTVKDGRPHLQPTRVLQLGHRLPEQFVDVSCRRRVAHCVHAHHTTILLVAERLDLSSQWEGSSHQWWWCSLKHPSNARHGRERETRESECGHGTPGSKGPWTRASARRAPRRIACFAQRPGPSTASPRAGRSPRPARSTRTCRCAASTATRPAC